MTNGITLGELLPELVQQAPWREIPISGVQDDSRRIRPGDLFVAIAGLTHDGHAFAQEAVRAGAAAVIAERPLQLDGPSAVPCIVVDQPERAFGLATARLCGEPSRQLELIGITGTNGKTTTAFLLEAILSHAQQRTGLVGTVVYRYGDHREPAPFTTPTPNILQPLLRRMVDAGCTRVVMEVSSHGLQLGRIWGCSFSVAAFTQLTQDHLDLHGTMEAYLAAKLRLFGDHLRPGGTAVVHLDGAYGDRVYAAVAQRRDVRLLRCSRHDSSAEVRLDPWRCDLDGLHGTLHIGAQQQALHTPLLGEHNAENLLVAAACAHAVGVDLPTIAAGAASLSGVPGRLERITAPGAPFTVLVDYAHTPDALERAIATLRPLCRGRLLVLFGCGGDRDRGKRPLMGAIATRKADLVIITSDNPRTEDPQAIIEEILVGARREGLPELANDALEAGVAQHGCWSEPDRERAIAQAVSLLRENDVLLIAGKGHEDYQIVGDRRLPFDDREHARAALRLREHKA